MIDACGGRGGVGGFEGVACDGLGGVANISLQGKGLAGMLSPAVAGLRLLTGLYLHYNALRGGVPLELANLTQLTDLYLGVNNFSGPIPPEIAAMASLQGERKVRAHPEAVGEAAMSHTKTRMEEAWSIEEVALNVPGLFVDCFIPPADIRSSSVGEACELPPPHGERVKAGAVHPARVVAVERTHAHNAGVNCIGRATQSTTCQRGRYGGTKPEYFDHVAQNRPPKENMTVFARFKNFEDVLYPVLNFRDEI